MSSEEIVFDWSYVMDFTFTAYDAMGLIGSLMVVMIFVMITFEKLNTQSYTYFCMNIVAAILLGASLLVNFNLGSMLIEVFWFTVSIIGIIRLFWKRKKEVCKKY